MARKKDHLLVILASAPWWASVVVAAAVFAAVRFGLPAIAGPSVHLRALATAFSAHAGWFALVFLLPLPFALVNGVRRRRLIQGEATVERLRSLSWQAFEVLVSEHYRRRGYRVAETGGGGADGGVDLVLRDAANKRIVVQCKRWRARAVGVEHVRAFYGALLDHSASAGIVVTSGRYTPDALAFARDKPLQLIDGQELAAALGAHRAPRQVTERPRVEPSLRTATPGEHVAHVDERKCPRCGGPMARRLAKRGVNAGNPFWGCMRFPRCAGTLPD